MIPLIEALLRPQSYAHPVDRVELIETHISWLLLTGRYAYKLKKPVDLGFVDFSTLERRRHFCEEELRLNRRLAPALYLDVAPIAGTPEHPRVGGSGEPIEYAVQMREFPQADLLDRRLHEGRLTPAHVDAIADTAAAFHRDVLTAPPQGAFGTPGVVLAPALENFEQIEARLRGGGMHPRLAALRQWTVAEHARLAATFAARLAAGHVREGHGDMHLGNMALVGGRPAIFDCIEFNPSLRWIDVASECAFTVMDFAARGHAGLGWRFLNRYLEATGDYAGLAVLPWYLVYRAMVRAKVDCIRASDPGLAPEGATAQWQDFLARIALAERYTKAGRPLLAITCGPSGSGKTYATQFLLEHLGAIRIRSDVERKRLHGLEAAASSGSEAGTGIYTAESTRRTFERLAALAQELLQAGQCVLVDATFLTQAARRQFQAIARAGGAAYVIIACSAPVDVATHRIEQRRREATDASEADREIFERQQQAFEPLAEDERTAAIAVDTSLPGALDQLAAQMTHKLAS
jgi:aminoglycoside phosphotransferase family enzyme/predicted kinase